MSQSFNLAFVSSFHLPSSRRPTITRKPPATCCDIRPLTHSENTSPIVATTVSKTPQLPLTPPRRSNQTLRTALLALLAAAAAFLPTRLRSTTAATHQHTGTTTIARAVPKSSTLSSNSAAKRRRPASKSVSHDPHAAGTPFAIAGTSAFLASAVAVAVTHPIDTIKTMRQAQALGSFTGPMTLQSLYRGVSSNIVKEAPNAAVYLAMYEVFKSGLLKLGLFANTPLLAMCVAGMLGDAVGSIVRVPAEIVNKRLQLGMSNGWHDAVKEAFLSENGVQSTLAAWFAVLWRDVPYGGLQIAGYEFVRLVLGGWGMHGVGYSVVAGAIAGLFAAVITTPADVLVTRMSTQSPQCYLETRQYMSASATFVRIVREEGFGALWTGALARGLFYMPMIGLFFAAYEMFKFAFLQPFAIGVVLTALLTGYGWLIRACRTPVRAGLLMLISVSTVFRKRSRNGRESF